MKTIGISGAVRDQELYYTLQALSEIFEFRFENQSFEENTMVDAWILPEADVEIANRMVNCDRPSYVVIRDSNLVPCGDSTNVEFAWHSALPPILRSRRMKASEASGLMALPRNIQNIEVLASKEGAPIWAIQIAEGHQHHYVSSTIPLLSVGDALFQYFNDRHFLRFLPLIIFLRSLTEKEGWEQPPLQASIMFDDPNLHWPKYGFIDFAKIAAHAKEHRYHVSFATIPQDAWYVHRPTASLFQQHKANLSLLIHGNNHTSNELARPYSYEEQIRNLLQALKRIAVLEQHSGVEVSRVMTPPHGACVESSLSAMAALGFEAACISQGSLRRYNSQATWLRTIGMSSCDIIAGLPVFPRFPLSANYENKILIAALLNQPIIARGHHYDLAQGLQLLADVSGFVNSLGAVRWSDMKGISRCHYARKYDGKILRVRMLTKRIEISVPEGISHIVLELPRLREAESSHPAWRRVAEGLEWTRYDLNEPIPVCPAQRIEIDAELRPLPLYTTSPMPNFHLWPVVRRPITELRDRAAPLKQRVRRFFT